MKAEQATADHEYDEEGMEDKGEVGGQTIPHRRASQFCEKIAHQTEILFTIDEHDVIVTAARKYHQICP